MVPAPGPDVAIPLVSLRRQRAQELQKIQHAIPAAALFVTGAQGILHHEHGFALGLAIAELLVSALLLRSFGKSLKATLRRRDHDDHGHDHDHEHGHGHSHGIEWFDVFASGLLTVEALEHWRTHHHVPGPTVLLAAVTLAIGLFHDRLAARRSRRRLLRIDATGIRITKRFFRRFTATWADLETIDIGDRWARIVARNGREHRIDFKDLPNPEEVRAALRGAQARLAVEGEQATV